MTVSGATDADRVRPVRDLDASAVLAERAAAPAGGIGSCFGQEPSTMAIGSYEAVLAIVIASVVISHTAATYVADDTLCESCY